MPALLALLALRHYAAKFPVSLFQLATGQFSIFPVILSAWVGMATQFASLPFRTFASPAQSSVYPIPAGHFLLPTKLLMFQVSITFIIANFFLVKIILK